MLMSTEEATLTMEYIDELIEQAERDARESANRYEQLMQSVDMKKRDLAHEKAALRAERHLASKLASKAEKLRRFAEQDCRGEEPGILYEGEWIVTLPN